MVLCSICFCIQKTAYELRIRDWSSYVCSSDLYHETTFSAEMQARATETFHSTAAQAAGIALKAAVKKLIIVHFSARYRELAPLLAEAQAVFPPTDLAREGSVFNVGEL